MSAAIPPIINSVPLLILGRIRSDYKYFANVKAPANVLFLLNI